jgi:hypothetical protein
MLGAFSDGGRVYSLYSLLGLPSAVIPASESHRTHNHFLLSQILRLLKPGDLDLRLYVSQEHDGPIVLPGTGFQPFH